MVWNYSCTYDILGDTVNVVVKTINGIPNNEVQTTQHRSSHPYKLALTTAVGSDGLRSVGETPERGRNCEHRREIQEDV